MAYSLTEIKKILADSPIEKIPETITLFSEDTRASVIIELEKANGRYQKYQAELVRTYALSEYERKYSAFTYVCGIDEVGRGPLAGPVVAGAVILPKDCDILYINDSKKLSEKKREELYDIIMEKAVATGIGYASVERIDEINILQATFEAMREAISKLGVLPDILLNDAVTIPKVDIKQVPIIKGDAKSISIGAASIIAKVTRDRLMVDYDTVFPEYGFASNKGYGSAQHIEAIKKYGPCPIHRRTFIGNSIGRRRAVNYFGDSDRRGNAKYFREPFTNTNEQGQARKTFERNLRNKGVIKMADPRFEKRLNKVENKVTSIETKIDMFIGEMRERDNQRAEDIREIRAGIESMGKHVRNLTIAAMVGMGTMTIAGLAIAISIILK